MKDDNTVSMHCSIDFKHDALIAFGEGYAIFPQPAKPEASEPTHRAIPIDDLVNVIVGLNSVRTEPRFRAMAEELLSRLCTRLEVKPYVEKRIITLS